MTIEHAENYLCSLRALYAARSKPTPRRAKKLAKAACAYWIKFDIYPPRDDGQAMQAWSEWQRFSVRIYDESIRLRAIAGGGQ